MGVSGLVLTLLAELSSAPLVSLFASYDAALSAMTCRGFLEKHIQPVFQI